MPPMEWIWLAATIVFAVAEAATTALVSLWFIGGALAALIAALCGAETWLQFVLFIVISAVLLLALRPLAKRHVKTTPMNTDRFVGQTAVVTEAIDNLRSVGAVRLSGVEWSARSVDGSRLPAETVVRVNAVESTKLIVEPIKEEV